MFAAVTENFFLTKFRFHVWYLNNPVIIPVGTSEFHYYMKKRKRSFGKLKTLFSSDTRQSMKRRITTER